MALSLEMTKNQVSQMAKMLFLNLDDIQEFAKNNPQEIEEVIKEEQQENTVDKKDNKQKQRNSAMYQQYTDDTICKIKIDNKKAGGI